MGGAREGGQEVSLLRELVGEVVVPGRHQSVLITFIRVRAGELAGVLRIARQLKTLNKDN